MEISVAHSPDSDDAFMFYALATGRIDTGDLRFRLLLKDIDSLNRAAESATYDVTAISFAAYPHLAASYQLLSCGASLGNGYGPIIVARRQMSRQELAHATIAIPGRTTSAYLALKLYLDAEPQVEEVRFDRIMQEVASGSFDAGVIIHEGQMTYREFSLVRIADLGQWWSQETALPLPLGANAIRRSLPEEVKARTARYLRESIALALHNQAAALDYALQFARDLTRERADEFVKMYVNDYTLDLGADGIRAVESFLRAALSEETANQLFPLEYVMPA